MEDGARAERRKTRTGHGPLALLEHGLDGLDNAGVGLRDVFGL